MKKILLSLAFVLLFSGVSHAEASTSQKTQATSSAVISGEVLYVFANGSVTASVRDENSDATRIKAQFYVDGKKDSNYVGSAYATSSSVSNVVFQLPSKYNDGKTHSLYAYAVPANVKNAEKTPLSPFPTKFKLGTASLNNSPVGSVGGDPITIFKGGIVQGWAYDPDATSTPVTIKFYIDNKDEIVTKTKANLPNNPYTTALGQTPSKNTSFSCAIPPKYFDGKKHILYVKAQDVKGGQPDTLLPYSPITFSINGVPTADTTNLLSSTTTVPSTVSGKISYVFANGTVTGQVTDTSSSTALIKVKFYVDGSKESNYVGSISTTSSATRENILFTLPSKFNDGKSHNLYAYATEQKIPLQPFPMEFTLGTSPKDNSPIGNVNGPTNVLATSTVTGWAYDPDATSTPVKIKFYVDKMTNRAGSTKAKLPTDSLTQVLGGIPSKNASFSWKIPSKYLDGKPHLLYVQAVDVKGDQPNVLLPYSPLSFTLSK